MKKTITLIIAILILVSVPMNVLAGQADLTYQFSDVKETDWFYSSVLNLAERGYLSGYLDGTFRPLNNISVSEFTKILVEALGHRVDKPENDYWAANYIEKAKEINVIKEGEFIDYDRYITRGEIARMIVRAAEEYNDKIGLNMPKNYKEYESLIADYNYLDSASKDIALKIFSSGIMSGFPDGSIGFNKNATRAEICSIVIRLLEEDQRIIPTLVEENNLENSIIINGVSNDIEIDNNSTFQFVNEDGLNVTVTLKGSVSYEYPYSGSEHIMGPERTIYYAIYYDGNGMPKYGEIIREADEFVLSRVYPDGSYQEFNPPALTEKQKQDFIDKYDLVKQKERMEEKEMEMKLEAEKEQKYLIENNLLNISDGNNYFIYTYAKPNEKVLSDVIGRFSEANFGNIREESPYTDDIENVEEYILSKLNNSTLPAPLKIFITPYKCEEFPQGLIQFRTFDEFDGQEGLEILLFNNESISIEKQFDIQFENYFENAELINGVEE